MKLNEVKRHWKFVLSLGLGTIIFYGCSYYDMNSQAGSASSEFNVTAVVQPAELSPEELRIGISTLPKGVSSTVVSKFNSHILLAGVGQSYISHDNGGEWTAKRGIVGAERVTKDGGKTYENVGDIDIQRLCNVQSSVTTKSGRSYLVVTCEHTVQIWSLSLTDPDKPWFITNFTYKNDPSEGTFAPRPQIRKFGDTVLVAAYLPGGSGLLTSDDEGKSWKPYWIYPDNDRWILDFDVVDRSEVIVLDNYGSFSRIDSSGEVSSGFSVIAPGMADRLRGIRFKNIQEGYVFGESGVVYRTVNSGKTWMQIKLPPTTTALCKAVFAKGEKEIWFSGNSDEVFVFNSETNNSTSRKLGQPKYVYFRMTETDDGPILVDDDRLMHLSMR